MASADSKAAFDEYMRTSRVFILGAGFSAAAGIPLTAPLLREAMQKFSIECPGLFERVNNYASDLLPPGIENVDYASTSFSELCTYLEFVELREYAGGERWSDAGCREKLALRFYLAKRIAEATPSVDQIPEIYLDFCRQLGNRDVIISFNWDGLIELALQKIGKKYTYNFAEEEAVKLCKLHGSVNWRLGEPQDLGRAVNSLNWEPIGFAKGFIKHEIWHTPRLLNFDTWKGRDPLREVQPFLVLPGYGKAFDVRSNATLWYRPEFAFAASRDIYIIGLGIAPDEHFVRSFFTYCLPIQDRHIFIINPDPAARSQYEFAMQSKTSQFVEQPFSKEHVDLIKSRLEVK